MLSAEAKLWQITQTEALIIPHILREPNLIIVLLFICKYFGLNVTKASSSLLCECPALLCGWPSFFSHGYSSKIALLPFVAFLIF